MEIFVLENVGEQVSFNLKLDYWKLPQTSMAKFTSLSVSELDLEKFILKRDRFEGRR